MAALWFYSTFYSNGRPYLVALFIQLFIFIQLEWPPLFAHPYLFNFLFQWPPLFGRTFYSTFYFYSTWMGRPYLLTLINFILITTDLLFFFFFFFFFGKKVSYLGFEPGTSWSAVWMLTARPPPHPPPPPFYLSIYIPIFFSFFFFSFFGTDHHTPSQQLSNWSPHPFTAIIIKLVLRWASVWCVCGQIDKDANFIQKLVAMVTATDRAKP